MTLRRWLAVGLCAVAGAAAAVVKGDFVYIRARNTRVLESPSSSKVVAVLQPGQKVTWQGKDSGGWHKIDVGSGKAGVVVAASLSLKPVQMELLSSTGKRALDANAFLSSGAATKALGPGAIAYGEKKDMKQAVHDVTAMEKIAKTVTAADVAEHARKVGIAEAVGPVARGGGK